MTRQYRFRFPIVMLLFQWGMTIAWQPPIIKVKPPRASGPEDSMLIYIDMFDEDD